MKINNCPICEGQATAIASWGVLGGLECKQVSGSFQVCCHDCGTKGPICKHETKAISMWNSLIVKEYGSE